MGGAVEKDGDDGDDAVGHAPFVGVDVVGFFVDELPGEHVECASGGVGVLAVFVGPACVALADDAHLGGCRGAVGYIDVEAHAFGEPFVEYTPAYLFDEGLAGGEVGVHRVVGEREADGGDTHDASFHGGAHGAGVYEVDAGVAAVVDAGHDHVGLTGEDDMVGYLDAVDRSTVDGVHGYAAVVVGASDAQG